MFAALRLADLRVRQGRVEEAERLLEGGEWHPTARRLAATIALARGDAVACVRARRAVCRRVGARRSDVCAGAGAADRDPARDRGRGGGARGRRPAWPRSRARRDWSASRPCAALADGRVAAAEGDERAVGRLKRAVELFASLEPAARRGAGAARAGAHARGVRTGGGRARGQARDRDVRAARRAARRRRSGRSAARTRCRRRHARGRAGQRRSHAARTRCWACSQKAARMPRSRSGW